MNLAISDIAAQMNFLQLTHADNLKARLNSRAGRHYAQSVHDPQLVYMLEHFMMRHTMTQTRQGQRILRMVCVCACVCARAHVRMCVRAHLLCVVCGGEYVRTLFLNLT